MRVTDLEYHVLQKVLSSVDDCMKKDDGSIGFDYVDNGDFILSFSKSEYQAFRRLVKKAGLTLSDV